VTSDLVANTDAAIHVAHAFTVHALETELDYFTVVDDLKGREQGDDAGAAGVFDAELTSGLYYGYVVIDVPLLVSNIEGVKRTEWKSVDRSIAGEVVRRLVHLIATVSPGAKKGSTAPYSWAEAMLAEAGSRQPRTLANAFRCAVPLDGNEKERAIDGMIGHLKSLDANYGTHEARRAMLSGSNSAVLEGSSADRASLPEIADWAKSVIIAGSA
ncbi:MAG: type I-E CRISPR-associated protein Cas7/Cse4/CasC, partial [Hyphomicrobiaceae bacterium]